MAKANNDDVRFRDRLMFWRNTKARQKVKTTLYDLTHLEINTIIKDEMDASKAPDNVWLLLNSIAAKYHKKLMDLGEKYSLEINGTRKDRDGKNYFRGRIVYGGCSYLSFKELRVRARDAIEKIKNNRDAIVNLAEDEVNADVKMLERISTISQDLRNILQIKEEKRLKRKPGCSKPEAPKEVIDFDRYEDVKKYRSITEREARKYDLDLDLRQLMVIQKANDLGTESVIMQTIIGMDGDVTTRISKAFANNPVNFISDIHHNAITTSVEFWKTLVGIVMELGKQMIKLFRGS